MTNPLPLLTDADLSALDAIQRRVLWLAVSMVHHANHVRPNPDESKIGGHQASSASITTILTALYFAFLREGDRVSVKPHASPVYHAIQYLLGRLPREYLTSLRAYHGLQAYPSRTKDPDTPDFSTGSVGLGAVAPAFAAVAHHYARRLGPTTARRFVAIIGDAELDEGNVWEAVLEESLSGIDNLLWIVDLNRQSLDRVIPGIRAARLKRLFTECGWQVLEAKYGRTLQALFARPGGDALQRRIDEMSNEEYQALIRLPGPPLRARLTAVANGDGAAIASVVADVPDERLPEVVSNLGGHDMAELLSALAQANAPGRPTILFAYTIKGWRLPLAGHPLNHSALLSAEQMEATRERLGIAPGTEWDAFAPGSAEGRLAAAAAARIYPANPPPAAMLRAADVPDSVPLPDHGRVSTQEAFGRALVLLSESPALRERIVTVSPDVAVSTNLSGWINKTGVFALNDAADYETEAHRLLHWKPGPRGQHIELGISEMNLFMLLGMLGLSAELSGQQLIPIGTVYDPFILRGLDALIYGVYSGSKFIFAGTPSGITLSPEGGSHQSTLTPSVGLELPNLHMFEPAFACEVGWALLDAIRECCDRAHGRSTYLRLSTKLVDQSLLAPALARLGAETMRRQTLAGGYRIVDARADGLDGMPLVNIAAVGMLLPEAIAAAAMLRREGLAANVLNLTSPRRLYETWRAHRGAQMRDGAAAAGGLLDWLIPPDEHAAPIITVQDGASHALSWLGNLHHAPVIALGVDEFGQSSGRGDLYRHFGMDAAAIAEAALSAWDLWLDR